MPLVHDTIADVKSQTLPCTNTTLDKFGGTADTGNGSAAQIRDLFGDTKSDFRGTMKNLNSATATIDQKLPAVMDDIHEVLDKAKGTSTVCGGAGGREEGRRQPPRDITASGRRPSPATGARSTA